MSLNLNCEFQFKVIHNLDPIPASDLEIRVLFGKGNKAIQVNEYMEIALHGVRQRCIQIHNRKNFILSEWQKYQRLPRSTAETIQDFSECLLEVLMEKSSR